eukprot:scaffold402685_cov44-Prasinocladus_malaysianus.AAC.1
MSGYLGEEGGVRFVERLQDTGRLTYAHCSHREGLQALGLPGTDELGGEACRRGGGQVPHAAQGPLQVAHPENPDKVNWHIT